MVADRRKPIPLINLERVMPKDKTAFKCSPHLDFENGSCIPLELLIEMADAYNQYFKENPEKQITLFNKTNENESDYKKYLLFEFKNKFEGDQKDWIESKYLELMSDESKDYLENKVFRPEGPQGRFDWLSTIDINKVLYQYEEKYNDFKFLGAVPLDFMDLDYLVFKKMNLNEFQKNNINRIGVIFNTDKSTQRGKHWISLFCDFSKGQIYFSDSMGTEPPKEIKNFINMLAEYIKNKKHIEPDIKINKTQHQKGNSECGVYSINFILRLLKGKSFEHITRKRLSDEKVNKCRIKYFGNTEKSN
jgi:hypothetical protein